MKLNEDKLILDLKHKKLSYGKLADALGICRTTLWNKINGKSDFKASEISKLKEMFGKSIFLD